LHVAVGAGVGLHRWFVGFFVVTAVGGLGFIPAAAAKNRTAAPGPCAEAQALQGLDRLSAAETAYIRELANPAAVACATAGLKELGRLDESCAYADSLARDGERQASHAAYLRVLAADPSSRCAAGGLKATVPPNSTPPWTTAGNVAKDAAYVVGVVLLALLLLIVVTLLWLQVQTRVPGLRDQWPAKRIRKPVFVVEDLNDEATDEKYGSAVAGLIRGRVKWRTDRFGLNLVSGQAGVAKAFSGLVDISSEAKAAVAVIEFLTALLPRRRFRLSGQLQPAGAEGVGISLELTQNGAPEAMISLWSASFDLCGADPVSAYQHLAVACAAWVDIWMAKALDDAAMLTADPQSWAFFRSGVDAQRLGDVHRAQMLYEQALAADGSNVGAMANLGIMSRRAHRYEDAKEYLQRALKAIEDVNTGTNLEPQDNPDWYRIKYQFAALYTNWAVDTDARKDELLASAAKEGNALALTTLDVLARLDGGGSGRGIARDYETTTLKLFLEGTIAPSILVLVAGTVVPPPDRPAGRMTPPERTEIRASLKAGNPDPWKLISYIEHGASRPPATLFNLACFYTRAGDFSRASRRLLSAVRETQRQERPSLVRVALTDSILRPLLRRRPGLEAKLYEMLVAPPELDNAQELAKHFDRQDHAMVHFRSEGWDVKWEGDSSGFDLQASKDAERMLISLLIKNGNCNSISNAIDRLRQHHRDLDGVKVLLVVPPGDYPIDDLITAQDHGVTVLRETETGFECLSAAASVVHG
jgi:tetratricopeptide (TPR) repeat protein